MKRLYSLLIVLLFSVGAYAQISKFPVINEIVTIEEDDDLKIQLFSMVQNGQNLYFLDAGTLGIGDEIIQLQFDPLYRLFIPLGTTLNESMETLKQLQDMYKQPAGTTMEINGCFAPAIPNEEREPIKITTRKLLLSRMLEFSIERDGYLRSTHINKSDFGSLVASLKFYRKFHPNEE